MKSKAFVSLSIAIILLLTSIGAANADISFLTTDGVWGAIDGGGGASGDRWGTGPSGETPIGTSGLVTSNSDPAIQSPPTNDWNQVRYGTWFDIPGLFEIPRAWASQSGFAFKGTSNAGSPYGVNTPFLVGKFCHINNPINAANPMTSVPLTLTLNNLSCGNTAIAPFPPSSLSFIYPVSLDETNNSGLIENCPYGGSATVCDDGVAFSQTNTNITCNYPGNIGVEYTVALIGFIHLATPTIACDTITFNQNEANGIFISPEGTTNCGCLYAMITEGSVTAVSLYSFEGVGSAAGVTLTWETADETDNLGFNVYRADSLVAEKVQLNTSLLPTNVPPGSPFGALYSFEDLTAEEFQTYFYWLEDVDVNGTTTLHGPVMVEK